MSPGSFDHRRRTPCKPSIPPQWTWPWPGDVDFWYLSVKIEKQTKDIHGFPVGKWCRNAGFFPFCCMLLCPGKPWMAMVMTDSFVGGPFDQQKTTKAWDETIGNGCSLIIKHGLNITHWVRWISQLWSSSYQCGDISKFPAMFDDTWVAFCRKHWRCPLVDSYRTLWNISIFVTSCKSTRHQWPFSIAHGEFTIEGN